MAAAPVPGNGAEPELPQVWLVTYGPGEVYWQRFGHNAIWIREPARGLDHVFNFGFFDFAQQDFFLRFLQGRMMYFSAAQPAQQEFAAYIDENRSIRAQRLDLSPEQAHLLDETHKQFVRAGAVWRERVVGLEGFPRKGSPKRRPRFDSSGATRGHIMR